MKKDFYQSWTYEFKIEFKTVEYIISQGNNPELVCRHLSKLYDSIAKLKWKMDGDKPTKHAIVMIAKDGENMSIYGTCDCSGKVFTHSKYNMKI